MNWMNSKQNDIFVRWWWQFFLLRFVSFSDYNMYRWSWPLLPSHWVFISVVPTFYFVVIYFTIVVVVGECLNLGLPSHTYIFTNTGLHSLLLRYINTINDSDDDNNDTDDDDGYKKWYGSFNFSISDDCEFFCFVFVNYYYRYCFIICNIFI